MPKAAPIAVARIVGSIIASILLVVAAFHAWLSYTCSRAFDNWQLARPMEATVDLSQPGKITIPFEQTCQNAHGEGIYLDVNPQPSTALPIEKLLVGLDAKLTITDQAGNEVESLKIGDHATSPPPMYDPSAVAMFHPFPSGEYVATLYVIRGAPQLAGRQQTLYARYLLCGLEVMPAYVCGAIAMFAGIIGVIVASASFPGLYRDGLYRRSRGATDFEQQLPAAAEN